MADEWLKLVVDKRKVRLSDLLPETRYPDKFLIVFAEYLWENAT
jgi:hypothetical protein